MSVRLEQFAEHTSVRGTQVSTCMFAPSTLHSSVLRSWGLPNAHGAVVVDGTTIYVRFDHRNPDVVYAWAHLSDETDKSIASHAFPAPACSLV